MPYHYTSIPNNGHSSSAAEHNSRMQELEQYSKLKANLARSAPTFDGTSDFDMFVTNFHEFLSELPYCPDAVRRSLLRGACKGVASKYLGTVPAVATLPYEAIMASLQ